MNVYWLTARSLCWDQNLLDVSFEKLGWQQLEGPPEGTDGCVLVVPARYWSSEQVNEMISGLEWVLVVLSSDEESTFDQTALDHPRLEVWVMTPRPDRHHGGRYLGEGFPPDTNLSRYSDEADRRPIDVFFAGQVTHDRREACMNGIAAISATVAIVTHETEGFAQGLERPEYLRLLAGTKIAPCPSGPVTPDSFRIYEALEAGCLPIADATCPALDYPDGYWNLVYGDVPFPVITDWAELPKEIDSALEGWPANANRASAWWQQQKRLLRTDLEDAAGITPQGITVIIPTSPIPSHPSVEVIDETIRSVRSRLPHAEILVMADGVRPEQEHRRADYEEYLRRLLWLCSHTYTDVIPVISDEHRHQANLTRRALELTRTPLVLFVEHDTPLVGDVDWDGCCAAVRSGMANVIRFHHEASVLEPHRHLMLDEEPQMVEGVPLLRTAQWSQRPHLASAGFYRSMIDGYFGQHSRTMIEDVMHGVVDAAWRTHHHAGWEQFRVWMYAPEGNLKRSTHLDGRGDDLMFPMVYAYDGETPFGAPAPVPA